MRMKVKMKVIGVVLACGLLAACANGQNVIGQISNTSVPPSVALVAANSFDALEAVATAYLQLPPCGGAVVVCRQPAAVANIVPAVRSGRVARNQIESLLSANSGAPIPIASYNTLTAAISTLQAVDAQFNIASK
jgi:hypothetical protein